MFKQRIVFSVTNDLSFDQRMQRICDTLHQAGYTVELVGRNRKDSIAFDRPYLHFRLPCYFQSGKLFYMEFSIRLFFYLVKYRADAYCAVDLDTMLPVMLASKWHNKPWVYDAHELFQEVPEVVDRPVIQWLWSRIASFGIPRANAAYTVSNSLAAYFNKRYNRHFDLVRNLPKYKPHNTAPNEEKFLLYQGALNAGRGLELLIDAAHEIACPIYIAGKGDLADDLKRRAAESPASNRIIFLGSLEPDQLANWTNKAHLGYNMLANNGLSYYYSLANKFFDYTMAGVPCLVSPFPEYQLMFDQFGIGITVEFQKEILVAVINKLSADDDLRNQLSKNALEAAKELNWEKEEKRLIAIYEALFARQGNQNGSND